jgi:multidrug efflux pump subunit AcrA (membrane-fusion protein)
MQAAAATFRYKNAGTAIQQRMLNEQQRKYLAEQAEQLLLRSPISGVVLTPRLADRQGDYLGEGTVLAEIADLSVMRARIYVSEYDIGRVHDGADVRIAVDGLPRKWNARSSGLAVVSSLADPSLVESSKYKGLVPPRFYCEQLSVSNADGALRPGMRGTARIYGRRRALASFAWETVEHFLDRKLW